MCFLRHMWGANTFGKGYQTAYNNRFGKPVEICITRFRNIITLFCFIKEKMLVFRDVEPKAKVHLLAIPKEHFKLLSEMDETRAETLKYMLLKIPQIAKENGLVACPEELKLKVKEAAEKIARSL